MFESNTRSFSIETGGKSTLEKGSIAGDERVLHYDLRLVYSAPTLMSFYGSKYQYCGGVHGSVRYITKTFWQQGNVVRELSLDDLFLSGYREWLFRYCEDYFKLNRCGYYSYDDYSWVGFNPDHLDAFLLTEKGLLLIFQNYVVSGYDDYPMTLLISYDKLTPILKQKEKAKVTTRDQAIHSMLTAVTAVL